MKDTFFTSKQAAEITGCTLRQLQYWREKGVAVPTISATGTGRSVYYSQGDLAVLAVMDYLLRLGLSFDLCRKTLMELQEYEQGFFYEPLLEPYKGRYMLLRMLLGEPLELRKYNPEWAMQLVSEGQPAIPIWIDLIQKQLVETMERLGYELPVLSKR